MKRYIKSADSPFKQRDESWDQYYARKARIARSALEDFKFCVEDHLDETLQHKIEEVVDLLIEFESIDK